MPLKDPEARRLYQQEYRRKNWHKLKARHLEYYRSYYRRNRSKENERSRAWDHSHRKEVSERGRVYSLAEKFGISVAEYDALLKIQGGVCALCGAKPKTRRLAVDHDHETGRVRGLLCIQCNTSLGQLGDNANGLFQVIEYLGGLEIELPY